MAMPHIWIQLTNNQMGHFMGHRVIDQVVKMLKRLIGIDQDFTYWPGAERYRHGLWMLGIERVGDPWFALLQPVVIDRE